ncbi:uncharacterized protein LOC132748713 [Ruditapes philippinarum]|uniref:uncharacterized protein LOC132748713 n=1 Tax=Ruditapes philippinarum TaxID=129788 RepID=UPI00295AEF87|nr:uncharacterized protein LOC132748713 [Ruditapes philippinarum]
MKKSFFVIHICFYFYAVIIGLNCSLFFELFSEDEKFETTIASFDTTSAHTCLILCNATTECYSVNFHKENEKCQLTDYYPLSGRRTGVPEAGWKVYFRRFPNVNLLDSAVAWQSLSGGTSAEKAIDGVTTSYATITTSCFYQEVGNSYWAVEFGTAGLVKEVDLFLYSLNSYYRNTGFTVSVATTRNDVINDVGTVCGTYFGPEVSKAPFKLTMVCENAIYGKFLKVQHTNDNFMQLCEVVVRTPFN